MQELKKGDFTGIYSQIDGKPLFYTGVFDRMKDEDGRPCVFLATDTENKNTFYRWTQSDLLKRGYYITKTGKNTIPRDAARLHIIFTHSGSLDGIRATVERDMFGEWIITTETGEKYSGIVGQLRNTAFCVILKTETAEEITTRPQEAPTTAATTPDGETTTGTPKAPQDATSEATTGPETSTHAQDTTGSDTRPPRATEDATTGHAANTGTPATAAGKNITPPRPRLRECPRTHGNTASRTNTHRTHQKPATGQNESRPRPPGKQRNFCFFGLTGKNRSKKSKLST